LKVGLCGGIWINAEALSYKCEYDENMQFHILLLYFIAGFLRICGYFVCRCSNVSIRYFTKKVRGGRRMVDGHCMSWKIAELALNNNHLLTPFGHCIYLRFTTSVYSFDIFKLLTIVLYVLQFTASDYPFGIFQLFPDEHNLYVQWVSSLTNKIYLYSEYLHWWTKFICTVSFFTDEYNLSVQWVSSLTNIKSYYPFGIFQLFPLRWEDWAHTTTQM
jgi:hypothetical protein